MSELSILEIAKRVQILVEEQLAHPAALMKPVKLYLSTTNYEYYGGVTFKYHLPDRDHKLDFLIRLVPQENKLRVLFLPEGDNIRRQLPKQNAEFYLNLDNDRLIKQITAKIVTYFQQNHLWSPLQEQKIQMEALLLNVERQLLKEKIAIEAQISGRGVISCTMNLTTPANHEYLLICAITPEGGLQVWGHRLPGQKAALVAEMKPEHLTKEYLELGTNLLTREIRDYLNSAEKP